MLRDIISTHQVLETAIATPANHPKTKGDPAVEVKRDVVVSPPPPMTVLVTVDRDMIRAEEGYTQHPIVARNFIQVAFTGVLTEIDPDTLWQLFVKGNSALTGAGWTFAEAEAAVADRQDQPLHVLVAKYNALSG